MGAYLFYSLKDPTHDNAKKLNDFLDKDEFNLKLQSVEAGFMVISQEDIDWATERKDAFNEENFRKILGSNDYKVSYGIEDTTERLKIDYEDFFEETTQMFERINKEFTMKYLAGSCAFDSDYYSDEQVMRMTEKGKLLTGNKKKELLASIHSRAKRVLNEKVLDEKHAIPCF